MWSIRDQVKTTVLTELIRVLLISRVGYYGLPNFLLAKLQRTMYSAASLIFRLSLSTPTSSHLKQLHWLPIRQPILIKILLYAHHFVYQPGKVPLYLSDLMKRWFQGPNVFLQLTCSQILEDVSSHAVPVEWNKLFFELKLISSEILFQRKLICFNFPALMRF